MTGILLTRPLEDNLMLARQLRLQRQTSSFSLQIYLQSLLEIKEKNEEITEHFPHDRALIFTSKHAVKIWASREKNRKTPVFCVGHATATFCAEMGFQTIIDGGGNAKTLLQKIQEFPPRAYLFPSGADVTLDFEEMLGTNHCRRIVVYETLPVRLFRSTIRRAFEEKKIQFVTLFSKKSAIAFKNLLKGDESFEIIAVNEDIALLFPNYPFHILREIHDLPHVLSELSKLRKA